MLVRTVVVIGALAACLAGCAKPLSLEDRSCPCIDPGWVCCQGTCVPRDRADSCSAARPRSGKPPVEDPGISSPSRDGGSDPPDAPGWADPDALEPEEPDGPEPEEPDAPEEPEEPDAPEAEEPDAAGELDPDGPGDTADGDGLTVPGLSFTLPPEGGAVSGSLRLYAVSRDVAIDTLEVWVDGALRNQATGAPTSIVWATHRETLGAHTQAAHRLTLVAIDRAGNRHEKSVTVRVVAPLRGDCDSNGVLNGSDIAAAMSEDGDGDAGDVESTPEGSFLGSPACDANDDNVVDMADAACIRGLYYGPPGHVCVPPELPAVRTILFLPVEYHHLLGDGELTGFMRDKIEEVRRFVARHNRGRTFRASPVEVFRAPRPRAYYLDDSTVLNYESVLSEFLLGYVESSNKALTPWNRAVWVIVLGGGASIETKRYANGHSYALMGDAHIHAAKDLDCSRVNPVAPGDQIQQVCLGSWQGSGKIYGHSMGRAVQALLAALGAPLLEPSSSGYSGTVMGDYTRYPDIGLSDADRAVLEISHFFPGSQDRSPAVASILAPAAEAPVSGTVEIQAAARDNYGVKALTLSIDGRQVHPMDGTWCPESDNCARSPFEGDESAVGMVYSWDTAAESPGPHTISFQVEDVSGNRSEAQATVTVQR